MSTHPCKVYSNVTATFYWRKDSNALILVMVKMCFQLEEHEKNIDSSMERMITFLLPCLKKKEEENDSDDVTVLEMMYRISKFNSSELYRYLY